MKNFFLILSISFIFCLSSCLLPDPSDSNKFVTYSTVRITVQSGTVSISGEENLEDDYLDKTDSKPFVKSPINDITKIPEAVFNQGETFEYSYSSKSSITIQVNSITDDAVVVCNKYDAGAPVTILKDNIIGLMMFF